MSSPTPAWSWTRNASSIVLGSGGQATAAAQSGLLDNELRFRVGVRADDTAHTLPTFWATCSLSPPS